MRRLPIVLPVLLSLPMATVVLADDDEEDDEPSMFVEYLAGGGHAGIGRPERSPHGAGGSRHARRSPGHRGGLLGDAVPRHDGNLRHSPSRRSRGCRFSARCRVTSCCRGSSIPTSDAGHRRPTTRPLIRTLRPADDAIMRLLAVLACVAFLCQGCFVLDEIDKGHEILDQHSPRVREAQEKAAAEAERKSKPKGEGEGLLASVQGWWKKKQQPKLPERDPEDVVVRCQVGGPDAVHPQVRLPASGRPHPVASSWAAGSCSGRHRAARPRRAGSREPCDTLVTRMRLLREPRA